MANIAQLLTEHMDIWTSADTEKKSGRGRASGNAASVYGVKKLRELILDLAVRGKLVPQDANDEPAGELLKRVQAEKAKLIPEGKLKKEKPLALISDDEKPFKLPKGWEWVYLPDVTDYKVGKTPSTKSSVYWTNDDSGYNWVSIADLNHDGMVTETTKKITDQALKEVFKTDPVPTGTILMSFKLTLGKVSILHVPAFHNEAIISIYPSPAIDKNYLFKILPARANEGDSKSAIKGNTLNSESIAALLLPLPPLPEQQRIVAKVDELMALCTQLEQQHSNAQEAHETLVGHLLATLTQSQNAAEFNANWQRTYAHFDVLFTTEASIDALKQTVLQFAYSGRFSDKNVDGWQKVKLNAITLLIADIDHKMPKAVKDGVIFLSAKDLKDDGTLDFSDPKFISREDFLRLSRRILPRRGDIIYSRIGARLGKARLVEVDTEFLVSYSCCVIRPDEKLVNTEYLVKFLDSRLALDQAHLGKQSIGVPDLGLGVIKEYVIPLPPLAEQHHIVAKVDELIALCDQLKTRIQQASQQKKDIANNLVSHSSLQ